MDNHGNFMLELFLYLRIAAVWFSKFMAETLSIYMFELWQFIGSQKIKPFLAV